MSTRHISIDNWLNAINMADYAHHFRKYGGVEEFIHATDADIIELGIHNEGQRLKVMSSLRLLRDKVAGGQVSGGGLGSPQHRMVNTPTALNSPSSPYPDFQFTLVSPDKLQSDLQKELSGDHSDLRTKQWYHGNITRHKAESLVLNNGDFLVRDCISKPGDFVLTCRWNDDPLNFIINAIISYYSPVTLPSISYQFEENTFPTIHQLIRHYQKNEKPVTIASEAVLKTAVPRLIPLSYYDGKYGGLINSPTNSFVTPNQSPVSTPFVTPFTSPQTSPNMSRRHLESTENRTNHNKVIINDTANNKSTSRPTSLDNLPVINITPPGENPGTSAKPGQDRNLHPQFSTFHTRADSAPAFLGESSLPNESELYMFNSKTNVTICKDISKNRLTEPPPKPSRQPSLQLKQTRERAANKPFDDSDYTQDNDTCLYGCLESPSKFIEDIIKHLSPVCSARSKREWSPDINKEETNPSQNGNYREETLPPSSADEQQTCDTFKQSFNLQTEQLHNSNQHPALVHAPTDTNRSNNLQTYKPVGRSKSFQFPRKNKEKCSRNSTLNAEENKPALDTSSRYQDPMLANTHQLSLQDKDYLNWSLNQSSHISGHQDVDYINSWKITRSPLSFTSNMMTKTFTSNFFSTDHRAFDQSILLNVKSILKNKCPQSIALHLTKLDLAMTHVSQELDFGHGVTSGLELITLPQGKQLRQDAIERWEALQFFTIATILTSEIIDDRSSVLRLWVQTCVELVVVGNLYSFAAVMEGLTCQHIQRLTETWLHLRQKYTESAFIFDTKLRPALISLNDASSRIPLRNISVPYITPMCLLLEKDLESVLLEYYWEKNLDPIVSAIDVLLKHLDVARDIASQNSVYRAYGKRLISSMNFDPELGHILCPEFQLMLLWGRKCLEVTREDRLKKMDQIFGLLSFKLQSSCDEETTYKM